MMWKWNVVIGVLIGIGSVCCRVTVRPQNKVVIRGERMSLECRTTNGSLVREWSFSRSSNPRNIEIIFSNWNSQVIIPRFGVDINDHGSGILYKNETLFDDAGTYTCSAFTDEEIIKFSAEVIVLESKPVCSAGEYVAGNIKTECSVGFSGNWAPKMEWRHHSRREANEDGTVLTQGVDYNNNGTHVTSKLNAAIINSAKASFSMSCKIFFDARDHIFPSGSATNVPDFVDIWKSRVFGSTNIVSDVPAGTTPGLAAVGNTMAGQSTDATRLPPVSSDVESRSYNPLPGGGGDDGKNEFWYWTLILVGGGVLAIILVSLLLGTIVCVIRKRREKENPEGNVDVIYRKKTTAEKDTNIYDSILICDDNGYVIPRQDPVDGDPRMDCLPGGPLDPYYVTTLTKQPTSNEAEKILKSGEMKEAKATRLVEEPAASSKLSEAKCIEAGNDKSAYLQVICDSEDAKVHERESPSSQSDETSPPYIAGYTPLVRKS